MAQMDADISRLQEQEEDTLHGKYANFMREAEHFNNSVYDRRGVWL
ncbi:hypothetical protein [Paenibacillus aceti]|uniref:Uncharacterized protein n=1 Tax=Paenibacillus aceti TaxID=1820010 RepID=A0ABQ1VYY0_9BACL|nr:hypothetical protein [Paenibacillus aceti]GGG05919.1 hypothetical protein GCM10010913_29690 [Paenibacillus aceti]